FEHIEHFPGEFYVLRTVPVERQLLLHLRHHLVEQHYMPAFRQCVPCGMACLVEDMPHEAGKAESCGPWPAASPVAPGIRNDVFISQRILRRRDDIDGGTKRPSFRFRFYVVEHPPCLAGTADTGPYLYRHNIPLLGVDKRHPSSGCLFHLVKIDGYF